MKTASTATPSHAKGSAGDGALTFVPVGSESGRLVPGAGAKLEAFYAKYPQSRGSLRKGRKGTVELVRQARDRR